MGRAKGLVLLLLAACVDDPGYIPVIEPMDPAPYLRQPQPYGSAPVRTMTCLNGAVVIYPGPCPL